MRAVAAAVKEIAGLFVDDGSLALAAIAWLALVAILVRVAPAAWDGVALFLGLAALLIENTRRSARRR
jgi:hypothetical protein